jgi:hypothetical protein
MSNMFNSNIVSSESLQLSDTTTMYDPIKGELISYVAPKSLDGSLSPPIKITTKVDDDYTETSLKLSSVAMTPVGPAIVTTNVPVIGTTLKSKIQSPYKYAFGSSFLTTDIFIPNMSIGASALRLPTMGDVCDTSSIRERVSKLYWKKMIEKWLYRKEDCKHLLKYLKVVDGKVKLIDSLNNTDDYVKNDQKVTDLKTSYIETKVMTLEDTYAILKQFVKGTNTSWCDLPKQSYFVKEALEKTIENKLKRMIETE